MKTTHLFLMSTFCFSQIHAFTLPEQPIKSYICDVCTQLSHNSLEDSWSIAKAPLSAEPDNKQKSYSYRERVTSRQLQAGVLITTQAPGAVIRITPLQKKSIPQLEIKTPDRQLLNLKDASALYSKDEESGDGLLSTKYQTMLQIKPELGAGQFMLKSKMAVANESDAYMINVFDKFSTTYIEVGTDSTHYQYGDRVTATITINDDYNYSIDDIDVYLVKPDGQNTALKLSRLKHNKFKATAVLNSESNDHGENWYVQADIQTGPEEMKVIKRSGHTAFSYSIPSATLLTVKQVSSKPLTFSATLEIATASRYSLQSVLFHKDPKGNLEPLETSQKSQWLEPGKNVVQFTFDNFSQLAEDSLYLGYFRVLDYGQLKPVYQYDNPIKLTQLVE